MEVEFMTADTILPPCMPLPRAMLRLLISSTAKVMYARMLDKIFLSGMEDANEFKKSGKKPSIFCKENLKMSSVKSYNFVKEYFENPEILVRAIKKYTEISKIRKGEYTLLDLLK